MCRVQSGIGRPSAKWMSHSIQPVCGAHGSTRKVVGSGSIITSAAPSSSFMPKPPPGCQTGNTVRCEVSFSSIVVVKPTPFFSAASTSPAVRVLPRSMPCWSAKASRTTDSSAAWMRRSASRVAALRSSVHRPARSTRSWRAYATSGGMVLAAQLEPLRRRASTSFQ